LHIVPKSPSRKHFINRECWCGPHEEDGLIIHEQIH
jgi:hypothetical protein